MNWFRFSFLTLATALLLSLVWSCGSTSHNTFGDSSGSSSGGSSGSGGADGSLGGNGDDSSVGTLGDSSIVPHEASPDCINLQCQVHTCTGQSTEITGQVFDPAGNNPLYNVVVYVPNSQAGALDSIPLGVTANSCSCDALFSGSPMAVALTDTDGKFTITKAPDGANIPLVVQIGKWRKEITLPSVGACSTTNVGKITLPKNLSDGQYASIPNIAVSTGALDTLECLLTRVGVDEAFFTGSTTGPGVHVFQGNGNGVAGGSPSSSDSLWNSEQQLLPYDIVMLSCEGQPTIGVDSTTGGYLANYVNAGGRVFAEHYHYTFFTGANFPYLQFLDVANWVNIYPPTPSQATDQPYTSNIYGAVQTTLPNGKAFPEGAALKAWLGNVGALTTGPGGADEIEIPSATARDNASVSFLNLVSTPWVQTDPTISPASSQYFSWDMPFSPKTNEAGVPQYCGRVVYSDMHVSGSAKDYQNNGSDSGLGIVPTGCDSTSALSPDEKAIEFILFDLSSCIVPIGYPPQAPQPEGGIIQ